MLVFKPSGNRWNDTEDEIPESGFGESIVIDYIPIQDKGVVK